MRKLIDAVKFGQDFKRSNTINANYDVVAEAEAILADAALATV